MTAKEILKELEPLGRESYKRILFNNYGVKEPCFGVAIAELKKFQKRIKKDYQLALDLYDTGNYDAMYLAGLIADDARMIFGMRVQTGSNGCAADSKPPQPLGRPADPFCVALDCFCIRGKLLP